MKAVLGLGFLGAFGMAIAGTAVASPSCDVGSIEADRIDFELRETTARYPELTPLFELTIRALRKTNDFNVVMASLTPSLGSCAVLSGSNGCLVVADKITELAVRKHRVARAVERGECLNS